MKRIKLNIEIEVDGKEADKVMQNLEKLSNSLAGSTKVTKAKPTIVKSPTKKAKAVEAPKAPKAVKAPKKTKPKKAAPISDADFIVAWESSEGTLEVAAKTGLTRNTVRTRAAVLKKKGASLKQFKRGRRPAN